MAKTMREVLSILYQQGLAGTYDDGRDYVEEALDEIEALMPPEDKSKILDYSAGWNDYRREVLNLLDGKERA